MATISMKSTKPGDAKFKPSTIANADAGLPTKKLANGVDIPADFPAKKPGIKTRGNGAAQRGVTARGPMA